VTLGEEAVMADAAHADLARMSPALLDLSVRVRLEQCLDGRRSCDRVVAEA
jgi:hypothetical protein